MKLFLFPCPRKAFFGERKLDFSDASWIIVPPEASATLKRAALEFAASASEFFPRRLQVSVGTPGTGRVLLSLATPDEELKPQQYLLTSGEEGLVLAGGSEAALFWGMQTLAQILMQTGVFIPEMTIDDAPDFEQRGYMLDVSRCKVPTMPELFALVDRLAKLKFNQFQLYMEHTFAFAAHETVWFDSSPLTAAEIIELDLYCQSRFIALVPNFNSFGHLERWLKFDEYKHLAECPDGYVTSGGDRRGCGGVLKPNDASLAFLDELYDELLPNFTSRLFNIGCDETWELGQGWSKPQCDEKGKTRVYLDFLRRVAELAQRHGRTPMFWGDIILHQPELIAELPENLIALNWGYEAHHPFAEETAAFARSGVPFYVCPGTSTWNSLTGRIDNALVNLRAAAEHGAKNGALGYLITDWGDGGHHQYPPLSWPGLCAGAGYSWCLEVNRHADIAEAVDLVFSQDAGGVIGDYLLEFGRLPAHFTHSLHNCTLYNRALFAAPESRPDFLEQIKTEEVVNAMQRLLELRGHLASAQIESGDRRLVLDELKNASYMAEAALGKLMLMKGGPVDLQGVIDLLRHVIRHHQRLWLARNREGGLNESSGRLRQALDELVAYSRRRET